MHITHSERMAVETEEQREVRLQRMRITHSERKAVETEEQREARLQRMLANQSDRLAAETEEQREARLQRMCANQSERLAAETEQQREARLQRDREGQQQPQLPLLEQPSVKQRCVNFIHSSVRWMCLHVPPVLRGSLTSNFIQGLLSVCPVVRISICQSCTHQTTV